MKRYFDKFVNKHLNENVTSPASEVYQPGDKVECPYRLSGTLRYLGNDVTDEEAQQMYDNHKGQPMSNILKEIESKKPKTPPSSSNPNSAYSAEDPLKDQIHIGSNETRTPVR